MSVDVRGPVADLGSVDVLVVGAGQAGLAAARAAQLAGLSCLVLDARDEVGGSWPDSYESLRLFSPARFSALPDLPMPGPGGRYPTRDEMTGYLRAYAERFGVPVRTRTRVVSVAREGARFAVTAGAGQVLAARSLVAASGGFGRPYQPTLPGATEFSGRLLHAATYRRPDPFAGRRVVVVGGGNSAVQVAVELAGLADVTLAVRRPLRLRSQRPLGVDVHHWARWTGLDRLPVGARGMRAAGVLDDGRYAAAIAAGQPDGPQGPDADWWSGAADVLIVGYGGLRTHDTECLAMPSPGISNGTPVGLPSPRRQEFLRHRRSGRIRAPWRCTCRMPP